jgi:hypothetical protein
VARLERADIVKLGVAGALVAVGLAGVGLGLRADMDARALREQWAASTEARRAERLAAVATPIWRESPTAPALLAGAAPTPVLAQPVQLLATEAPTVEAEVVEPTMAAPAAVVSAPAPAIAATPPPIEFDLLAAGFEFLDPPEPGARARLSLVMRNRATAAQPINVALPGDWMEGYRVSDPGLPTIHEGIGRDGKYRLTYATLPSGTSTLRIELEATAEGVEGPVVRVELATGDRPGATPGVAAWEARPEVVAPRPRPGPVMALHIDKLGLDSPVVRTAWEPPPFVVGELEDSAPITLGNTVLVGHLTGAAGAIFGHLDQLEPGDDIVAVSRGLEYPMIVTQTFLLPADDSGPTDPDGPPRLTLMTCAGDWDPASRGYTERLWVVAEPAAEALASLTPTADAEAEPTHTPTPAPKPTLGPTLSPAGTRTPAGASSAQGAASVAGPGSVAGAGSATDAASLGATRAEVESALGAPVAESHPGLFSYDRGQLEYRVRFDAPGGHAQTISMAALSGQPMPLLEAVQAARRLYPADAHARAAAPESVGDAIVERLSSALLARRLGSPAPTDFVAAYARTTNGSIARVTLTLGNTVATP